MYEKDFKTHTCMFSKNNLAFRLDNSKQNPTHKKGVKHEPSDHSISGNQGHL